jgi:hypothetical protein
MDTEARKSSSIDDFSPVNVMTWRVERLNGRVARLEAIGSQIAKI